MNSGQAQLKGYEGVQMPPEYLPAGRAAGDNQ